jgi:hypothetical protein
VTVAAINSKLGRVMLVAEWNRLRNRALNIGEIRGLVHLPTDIANQSNNENYAINARLGNGVHAAMKDLRHFESPTSKPAE